MALNIDDYFDEEDRPEVETPREEATERHEEGEQQRQQQPTPGDDEREYRDAFIVTNGQRRRRRWRRIIIAGVLIAAVAIIVNMLFISKKVDKGCVRGYLVKVELCDGLLFDSYECTMVTDYPDRIVETNDLIFHFSVRDKALGEKIYGAMRGDSMLLVNYVQYSTKMPWRGETDVLVDSATLITSPVLRSPEQVKRDKADFNAKQDTTKQQSSH